MVFTQILKKTLTFEGGWSNHPNDKGGATQFGVTQNTLDAYLAQKHQNSSNTYQDFPQRVSELTEAEASFIYQEIFFDKPNIALLPKALQPVIFDMAVNHGPRRAIKILQHVLNASNLVSIEADGLCGPTTGTAAHSCYREMGILLIDAICDERINFYQHIVAYDHTQQVFQRGWQRRANAFRFSQGNQYEVAS